MFFMLVFDVEKKMDFRFHSTLSNYGRLAALSQMQESKHKRMTKIVDRSGKGAHVQAAHLVINKLVDGKFREVLFGTSSSSAELVPHVDSLE